MPRLVEVTAKGTASATTSPLSVKLHADERFGDFRMCFRGVRGH